jgi:membrane-bound ClpP family serine protease
MGVAELFAGLRLVKGHVNRTDWIVQGLMTIGLALIVLTQTDDSVAVVGFLGAWAIVLGVYLAIAGVSQKSVDTAAKGSSTP